MATIRSDLQLNCENFLAGIRSVDSAVHHLQKNLIGFAAGFAALNEGGNLLVEQFEQVKETLDLGGELADMQANTGQGIADLVTLRQAFTNAGLGADSVTGSLAILAKALTGINEEGEPTKAVFEKLGLSIHALREMSAVQQFTTLGAAIRGLQNPADRAKAAMDLFGRSGQKMLALLTDGEAFTTADQQVGRLGETMAANGRKFDTISDAIGSIHLKFQQFYAGFAGASLSEDNILVRLSKMDFTDAGTQVGRFAAQVANIGGVVMSASPAIAGLGASMLANSLKARAAGTMFELTIRQAVTVARSELSGLRLQLAAAGGGMKTFGAIGKASFAGLVSSAKAAVAALGAVNIAVTAATAGFAYLMGQAAKYDEGTRTVHGLGKERDTAFRANVATINNVATQSEQTEAAKKFAEQLGEVEERIRELNHEHPDMRPEDLAAAREQLEQWREQLEWAKRTVEGLDPALLSARKAHQELAASEEQATKKAEELRKELGKNADELIKLKKEAAFEALPPEQQKIKLLSSVQKLSTPSLDSSIKTLDRNRRDGLYKDGDYQLDRLARMIDVRKQLFDVEKKITAERTKQAEKAEADAKDKKQKSDEAKRKRDEFERDAKLEIAKGMALGRGDKKEADRIDRQQRYDRAFKEAIDNHLGLQEADSYARQKVAAEDAQKAKDDKSEKEKAAAPPAIGVTDLRKQFGGGRIATDALSTFERSQLAATKDQTSAIKSLPEKTAKALHKYLGKAGDVRAVLG